MKKFKSNKVTGKISRGGGFTLAELLVVIAILAILIAIAVPVFTGMVADSQLRVNQANIRSVKSAAVAKILTNLNEIDDGGVVRYNVGTGNKGGWVALAIVDNAGTVSDLKVYTIVASGSSSGIPASQYHTTGIDLFRTGIFIGKDGTGAFNGKTGDPDGATLTLQYAQKTTGTMASNFIESTGTEGTDSPLAGINPKSGSTKSSQVSYYVVQVAIKDIDVNAKK